ncbi:MAG TPA: DNA mismatch repair endonuclease MutL [Moheibacter sp.]|nr:DNA mismatch repair endonuclease MutL [Moheibacter sp.]
MIFTGDVIQLLPDHVANQIAAGEVVQRPASVVKELMENAVDAKATEIDLIVKDAGRTLIQVVDNGDGMSITDLRLAFERHATSKIRTTEDIFHIQTKGFRGEALPSIAAVAQVDAQSRKQEEDLGNQLIIEGGTVRDQLPIAKPIGTSIAIKNLFYNVPARRNFLKSNPVELKHIQEEFLRVAMAHEQISFRFFHNDTEVYVLKAGNLKQRIVQIFGRKIDGQLVPINEETEVVKITGFVGKPESAKKQRGEQYFFVNQRFIRSSYLHKAVVDAFENLLPHQHVPSYFLYLTIDPAKIDINIHPTKTEIKFEEDYAIFAMLRSAVKHSLGQFNISPSLDFDQDPNWALLPSKPKNQSIRTPDVQVNRNFNPFESPTQSHQIEPLKNLYESFQSFETETAPIQTTLPTEEMEEIIASVFQWQNKYLITHYNGDLLVIDQNRAHQLVIFEQLKQQGKGNALSQRLLFPIEIESNPQEINALKSIEIDLVNFGFDITFHAEIIQINALPTEVKADDAPKIFADFLAELNWHGTVDLGLEITKIIAKNTAIKKGETLLPEQSKYLAQQLLQLEKPNFSPYGKAVFVQISDQEIFKKLN